MLYEVITFLVALRLGWRRFHPPPPSPLQGPLAKVAGATHLALYSYNFV